MRTSILSLALAIWLAHSWYPESCCAGHDCNPVPCEDLSELNDGRVRYRQLIFPKNKVWSSKDSQCHVCIFRRSPKIGNTESPICVFVQQGT